MLIVAGILLYLENFLSIPFVKYVCSVYLSFSYDLNASVPNFGILQNLIYAINITISPILILTVLARGMRPFKWAFLVPLYAYINMLIGTIILARNYEIFDFFWYRVCVLALALVIWRVLMMAMRYNEALAATERIKDLIIENYRQQLNDEAA